MTEKAKAAINDLRKAIAIAEDVIKSSNYVANEKTCFYNFHKEVLSALDNEEIPLASVKSLINTFLVSWNEGIGVEVEVFWNKLREERIVFQRKNALKMILKRDRFRHIDEAMQVAKKFPLLASSGLLDQDYTKEDIDQINKLNEETRELRVNFLKKCLRNKSIPKSKYLYFGDTWAYVHDIEIIDDYFTNIEYEELSTLWDKCNGRA